MESYIFNGKNLEIVDSMININYKEEFIPLRIPENLKNGLKLSDNHIFKVFRFADGVFEYSILKEGVLDGEYLLTYPKGQNKMQCFYKNGKLHGPSKYFGEAEQILVESWFIDGKRNGRSFSFYPSGSFCSKQNYVDNVWHGIQEFWYEDGTLKTTMQYSMGEVDGKVLLFYPNGRVKRELYFNKGNFVKEIKNEDD